MSKPGDKLFGSDAAFLFSGYVETEFLRAEAKERGYTVAGTAEEHYNNAIKASIMYWGASAADADAYLAKPEVACATAAGDWKQKLVFKNGLHCIAAHSKAGPGSGG